MLLRSSSTPILGSLLPSHLESPKHSRHHPHPELLNSPKSRPNKRLLANQTCPLSPAGIPPSSPSAKSSPPPPRHKARKNDLRRAQSEGNLEEMVNAAWKGLDQAKVGGSFKVECRSSRQMQVGGIENAATRKISMASMNTKTRNLVVEKDMAKSTVPSKLHLAKGLGVGGTGLEECHQLGLGGNGNDHANIEEYYKKMVEENPCDSLYLRNYAQFLHQTKKDLKGAEEYYSRAILADPTDADLLSQYGKLTWELHHDEERASGYFQRAVQVAPEDSHVLAAYAGFLWETEEEESYATPATNNLVAIKA